MNRRTLAICGAGLYGLLACSLANGQNDKVFGNRGTPTTGVIASMSADEIVIKSNGVDRRVAVNEVTKVSFSEEPNALDTVRDRVKAGQLEDALTAVQQIKLDDNVRGVVKQDVQYYTAYCQAKLALAGTGDLSQAASAMFAFVKDHGRGSYHYYEASEILGELALTMGRFDTAARFFNDVGAAPWPDYKLRSAVRAAHATASDGKYAQALALYDQVIDTSAAGQEKQLAIAGKAQCLAETGKPEEGLKLVQALVGNNDPQNVVLFARAYNAMGDCYRKTNKTKEALLAYLHTDILFNGDGDAHAEALYQLTQLWTEVKKPERSSQARNRLRESYGNSRWAAKL